MLLAILVFLVVTSVVMGAYFAAVHFPAAIANRKLAQRLNDVGSTAPEVDGTSVLRQEEEGSLPVVDKLIEKTGAATWLSTLIEQSGSRITPGVFVLLSVGAAVAALFVIAAFTTAAFLAPVVLVVAITPTRPYTSPRLAAPRKSRASTAAAATRRPAMCAGQWTSPTWTVAATAGPTWPP